jgi:hypothetical membrane protein
MPDFSSAIPSNQYLQSSASTIGHAIGSWVFYIIMAIIFVVGAASSYSLLKYADTKSIALMTAGLYLLVFIVLLLSGVHILGQIS